MVFGLIDRKNHDFYTHMSNVFEAINNSQKEYNWLIADCECYPQSKDLEDLLNKDHLWLSGEELTAMIEKEDFQWIWGILCGFEKTVLQEDVLNHPIPSIENYDGYYRNPLSMQHPLSVIEIAAVDCSYTLLITKNKEHYDNYVKKYPHVQDLEKYNIDLSIANPEK